ncbi:hypothetical protein OH76DRAFT_1411328 [Lentinus brumalis]|uniref:Uncharacterized protein n=1 Tax=Lentinus brumalis TaxID=2498619 RepID=A0A371CPW3_9APHY|nr:hypothetical protein OH76DRAFT_1411328 [Polyporus brumalis]
MASSIQGLLLNASSRPAYVPVTKVMLNHDPLIFRPCSSLRSDPPGSVVTAGPDRTRYVSYHVRIILVSDELPTSNEML